MKSFRRLLALSLALLVLVFLSSLVLRPPAEQDLVSPKAEVSSSFSFAVFSDIHSDLASLEKALERAKQDGIEFIIVTGDLTTIGKASEFRKIKTTLDESLLPYYAVPGNHDLWSVGKQANPFREVFGVDFQVFKKEQVKFILVNNADASLGLEGVIDASGQKQGEWLKRELAECPKVYCLVFAHMPLNHAYWAHIMGEDNPAVASQAANLVEEFKNYQVKELFAGHIHFLSSYELDGLKTTTTGTLFSNKDTQTPRFLEVTVGLPEVEIEKKEIWLN